MKKGYVNGSNLLLKIGGKAVGHCTSHKINLTAETKEHAVKPEADKPDTGNYLFVDKTVTKLSASLSFEGLVYCGETENGYRDLAKQLTKGELVEVECFERESDTKPYLTGNFVMTSLEKNAPANDDTTYSGQLENSGPFEFDEEGMSTGVIQTES